MCKCLLNELMAARGTYERTNPHAMRHACIATAFGQLTVALLATLQLKAHWRGKCYGSGRPHVQQLLTGQELGVQAVEHTSIPSSRSVTRSIRLVAPTELSGQLARCVAQRLASDRRTRGAASNAA